MSLWDNRPGMTGRIAMWPDRDIQRTSFPPNVTMVFGGDSDDDDDGDDDDDDDGDDDDGNSDGEDCLRNADEGVGNN